MRIGRWYILNGVGVLLKPLSLKRKYSIYGDVREFYPVVKQLRKPAASL